LSPEEQYETASALGLRLGAAEASAPVVRAASKDEIMVKEEEIGVPAVALLCSGVFVVLVM
jgi:hypothetical protein